jgi:hypothetical protein
MLLSKIIKPVLFICIMMSSLSGCYYDKEELLYSGKGTISCGSISAKFSTDVSPVIKTK